MSGVARIPGKMVASIHHHLPANTGRGPFTADHASLLMQASFRSLFIIATTGYVCRKAR